MTLNPHLQLTRRDVLKLGGAGAAALWSRYPLPAAALAQTPLTQPAPPPPNLIFILADDLGYGDLGCYGNREIPTPNIDALATGGLRFTDAYVTAPVSSPSRAGLLTGRYQQRFGHEFNGAATPGATPETFGMPISERTLADELSAAGYATGIVGKWHLGMAERFRPPRRGFAESYCFLGGWHNYLDLPDQPRAIFRNNVPTQKTGEYLTDTLTRQAQAFIQRHQHEPFFLYLAYNAPHTPLQATRKYLERFAHVQNEQRRTYMAMVSALDDGVGAVMDTLRALKLQENTLVVFLSDNGASTQIAGSNDPLRGRKAQTLEGGIRVPFIASWKGRIAPGVTAEPVMSFDLFPTALEMAGAPTPSNRLIDGRSLLPLLTTGRVAQPLHDVLFWRMGQEAAVRRGQYKLVRTAGEDWQLFDLAEDPKESRALTASMPQTAEALRRLFEQWEAQL